MSFSAGRAASLSASGEQPGRLLCLTMCGSGAEAPGKCTLGAVFAEREVGKREGFRLAEPRPDARDVSPHARTRDPETSGQQVSRRWARPSSAAFSRMASRSSRRKPTGTGMVEPVSVASSTSPAAAQAQAQRLEWRRLANSAITVVTAAWLLSVSLGVALHTGASVSALTRAGRPADKCCSGSLSCLTTAEVHAASNKEVKARLPLAWFDDILRRYGALLPFPCFAIR